MQVCKEEKTLGQLQLPVSAAYERAAMYTGVSLSSLYKFHRGSSDAPTTREPRIDKVDLDEFDMGVVRRSVQELILQHKIVPTVKTLKVRLIYV